MSREAGRDEGNRILVNRAMNCLLLGRLNRLEPRLLHLQVEVMNGTPVDLLENWVASYESAFRTGLNSA